MRAPHDAPSAGGPTVVTEARVRHSLRGALLAAAPTAETIYEFWVPQTNERADVAVIGDLLCGFEIKTERDSLKRLPRQAAAYTRVFDRCHVVVAPCHLDRAAEILPPWWGVLVIEGDLSMTVLREAETNAWVDAQTLVRLLWRDEAYSALCDLGVVPDRHAGRYRLWQLLLALLDLESLKSVVRGCLLHRDPAQARIPSRRFVVT